MNLTLFYTEIMSILSPVLLLAGMISLTVSVIFMGIDMLINAFCGRGIRIGTK